MQRRWTGWILALCCACGLAFGAPDFLAAQDPAIVGEWGPILDFPHVAVHSALLHTGEILFWAYDTPLVSVWDPSADLFAPVPSASNMFCSSQTFLADGRLLVAGGHIHNNMGLDDANIFDPLTYTWTVASEMAYGRWYPTLTALPDGRALVLSGDITPDERAVIPEIYDPATDTWTELPGAALQLPLYPLTSVLPSGRVFDAGPSTQTYQLDLATQSWSYVSPSSIGGGSAVTYRPGKVMKTGGWHPAVSGTAVIDMNLGSPQWVNTQPMAFPRNHHNSVLLPDGQVLVVGGTTDEDEPQFAVLPAELWNPDTQSWTTMAAMSVPRMYHSTALLLPDARVLSAGGDNFPNAQIYSPPYLFAGPRPVISSAPGAISYGSSFSVASPDATAIASVALLRPGATTHAFDHSQRYLELSFEEVGGGLMVDVPANDNLMPPGYVMLFLLSDAGVPSVAEFVLLGDALFVRGEMNGDGAVDLGDALYLLGHLFNDGPPPQPLEAGDVNDDEAVNVADVVYLLEYLFQGGSPPPPPFPGPGPDPT